MSDDVEKELFKEAVKNCTTLCGITVIVVLLGPASVKRGILRQCTLWLVGVLSATSSADGRRTTVV